MFKSSFALLLLVACKGSAATPVAPAPAVDAAAPVDPAYVNDMQMICDAPAWLASSGLDHSTMDPSQQARVMAEHISKTAKTDDARTFFGHSLAGDKVTPAMRHDRLAAEASRVGITSCAFAAWWTAPH